MGSQALFRILIFALLMAGNSNLGDPTLKNRKVDSETSALMRLIFRF